MRYATSTREKGGTLLKVTWVGLHDKYVHRLHQHDVGLLQVAEPVVFSPAAQPVRMAAVGSLPRATDSLAVSGWGLTDVSAVQ